MAKKVLIIAGEASGDLHGALLVQAIRSIEPTISFWGMGSTRLREAGVQLLWDASQMAVVGFSEVVRHLGTIVEVFRKATVALRRLRPDLLILIDYPEFNLLLARKARNLGIPVMYYISPQVWAWRSGRIRTIRRRVDKMVVILPFEEGLYREAGVDVCFVGHPLLDVVGVKDEEQLPAQRYACAGDSCRIGLLPGSRFSEIRALLPLMLDAAEVLVHRLPGVHFLLPLAATIHPEQVGPFLQKRDLPIEVVENNTHETIRMCDLIVAASGTVTLEAAILGTPLVVIYKVNPITYWLGRRMIRVRQVGLVNIVAGQVVAPELLQHEATPARIAEEVMAILSSPARQAWIRQRLSEVRRKLGSPGAAARAAAVALEMLAGH